MPTGVQQAETNLPLALQEMYNRIRERAEQLRQKPFEEYGRPRQAPLPPEFEKARALANETGGSKAYMDKAQAMIGQGKGFPSAYQDYMNPYIQAVVDRMRQEGGRTLKEEVLPALDAKFAGLGQFGSTRHQKMAAKAAQDIQRDISAQQERLLASGFQQGAQIFNADQARNLESANQMARLGALGQAGKGMDMQGLMDQGNYLRQHQQQERDMAYQDYQRQQQHDWQQLERQAAIQLGIPNPVQQTNVGFAPPEPTMNAAGSLGQLGAGLFGSMLRGRRRGGYIR